MMTEICFVFVSVEFPIFANFMSKDSARREKRKAKNEVFQRDVSEPPPVFAEQSSARREKRKAKNEVFQRSASEPQPILA